MIKQRVSIAQRLALVIGLLFLVVSLLYVPFEATLVREGDNPRADIGYHLIWSPPDAVAICRDTFGLRFAYERPNAKIHLANRRCHSEPLLSRAAITATATALATAALFLLLGALAKLAPRDSALKPDTTRANKDTAENVRVPAAPSLADNLLADLGVDFPILSGNAKKHDPLVITATHDYVAVEYAVVRHVFGALSEEYKLVKQSLLTENGRMLDELIFDAKPMGAQEWTGRRHFYFDITAGFNRLGE